MCGDARINNNLFPPHSRVKSQRNTTPSQWWGSFLEIWQENIGGLSLLRHTGEGQTRESSVAWGYSLIPHFRWISSRVPFPRQVRPSLLPLGHLLTSSEPVKQLLPPASPQPKMIVSKIILDQDNKDQQGERKRRVDNRRELLKQKHSNTLTSRDHQKKRVKTKNSPLKL